MAEVGEMAPDFVLSSHLDRYKTVRLSDFRGKKNVVLSFHPMAFTPVCSAQLPAYEKDLKRFEEYDAQILSISVDSQPCKAAWSQSMGGISYDLLSDFEPKGEVARQYGVYRSEGFSERATFIIDKSGRIIHKAVHSISEQPNNEDLLKVLRDLNEGRAVAAE